MTTIQETPAAAATALRAALSTHKAAEAALIEAERVYVDVCPAISPYFHGPCHNADVLDEVRRLNEADFDPKIQYIVDCNPSSGSFSLQRCHFYFGVRDGVGIGAPVIYSLFTALTPQEACCKVRIFRSGLEIGQESRTWQDTALTATERAIAAGRLKSA